MTKTTKKKTSNGAMNTIIQNPPISESEQTKEGDMSVDKAEASASQDKPTDESAEAEKQDSADKHTGSQEELDRATFLDEMIKTAYQPYYKDNKVWYVTSDDSVFLCSDRQHAAGHQRTLNARSGSVEEFLTIKTE